MTSQDLDPAETDEQPQGMLAQLLGRLSRWQKLLLVASIALMILGLGLRIYAAVGGSDDAGESEVAASAEPAGPANPDLAAGFVASGDPVPAGDSAIIEPEEDDAGGLETWSPVVFRLGFSFFVGFAIAYAVRSFVKISLVAIGLLLLALFGLQYIGLIEVNWAGMETIYDTSLTWLREQTAGFGEFIRGALPSAAMGGLGLVMGFRKQI